MSKDIGKRIRLLRKKKGLKQDELAAAIGVSPSAVSNYEQGTRVPKEDTLKALVDVLDSTPDYILWGTTPVNSTNSRPLFTEEDFQKIKNSVREMIVAEPITFANLSDSVMRDLSNSDLDILCSAVMNAIVKVKTNEE